MAGTLIAHVDCDYAKQSDLAALTAVCPPPSGLRTNGKMSYHPIPHEQVDQLVRAKLIDAGFNIIGSRYALSDPVKARKIEKQRLAKMSGIYTGYGAKALGILTVAHPTHTDLAYAVAWMSSYNKVWPLALAAGINVFACDNLSFSGDVVTYRRHTIGLNLDVETDKALGEIRGAVVRMDSMIDGLRGAPCSDAQFEGIVCDGIRGGIFGGTVPNDLLNAWRGDATAACRDGFTERLASGLYSDRNGWSAHNIITDCAFKRKNATGVDFMGAHKSLNVIAAHRLGLSLN